LQEIALSATGLTDSVAGGNGRSNAFLVDGSKH
jgi:hypothetical protein